MSTRQQIHQSPCSLPRPRATLGAFARPFKRAMTQGEVRCICVILVVSLLQLPRGSIPTEGVCGAASGLRGNAFVEMKVLHGVESVKHFSGGVTVPATSRLMKSELVDITGKCSANQDEVLKGA